MDNKNLNEVKSLIIIKQNIVSKINNFIKEIFYKILVPKDKIKYDNIKRTIEEEVKKEEKPAEEKKEEPKEEKKEEAPKEEKEEEK